MLSLHTNSEFSIKKVLIIFRLFLFKIGEVPTIKDEHKIYRTAGLSYDNQISYTRNQSDLDL